jgi:peptidoglycan/xylan/chitin deacetylase (PgdA/CDA1 family)
VRLKCVALILSSLVVCVTASVRAGEASRFTLDEGAVIRGDLSHRQIALVFTGGDYGEGTGFILDTLHRLHVSAGFFVTGAYLQQSGHRELLQRALREGHYVGPHSDKHLLYCSWEDRQKSLVTEAQFRADLQKNIDDLKQLGALSSEPVYFIPPYEWFNHEQVKWAKDMGVRVFNFSPGSGSNRDYLPEMADSFLHRESFRAFWITNRKILTV